MARSYSITHNRVTLLNDFVNHDKRLESLDLIRKDWLDAESRPKGDRRVVIPGVHDTFYAMSRREDLKPERRIRTANMLLLRCSLFCTSCFLYVDSQFLLGLVFVHWPSRIVSFIAIRVEPGRSPSERPVRRTERTVRQCFFDKRT